MGLFSVGLLLVLGLGLWLAAGPWPSLAQEPEGVTAQDMPGTAFTYQGQLKKAGAVVTDTCDFQFSLYSDSGGTQAVGSTQTKTGVGVSSGLFTVDSLDFGEAAFNGQARWLKIAVQCTSDGSYLDLSPLQALRPAPHAQALPGLYTLQNATSPNLIGGYVGNSVTSGAVGATIGGGGASGNLNRVTDDYGTVGGGALNRAGDNAGSTSDGTYATVGGGYGNTANGEYATVAGGQSNFSSGEHATVGGGWGNFAWGGLATVGGGYNNTSSSSDATVGGGGRNTASDAYATVGGGLFNTASAISATVSGGGNNTAGGLGATVGGGVGNTASYPYATVGGGIQNTASNNHATVGGGIQNTASYQDATVGGGSGNRANGYGATVGGGVFNTASFADATVGGGYQNTASKDYATVGGGYRNAASGQYATVPGGYSNSAAGSASFAAGTQAKANHDGAFVWGDDTAADLNSSAANQFLVRANGGVWFGQVTGNFTPTFDVATVFISTTTGGYLSAGGVWTNSSDREAKENFAPVDGRQVLARLATVPVSTWNYKAEDPAVRHIGPTAQDFHAAFGVGDDNTHLATVDTDGVALAAIQGLYRLVREKDAQIAALERRVAQLEATAQGGRR